MYNNNFSQSIAAADGISFYVVNNDTAFPRPFGIMATMDNDRTDSAIIENIFFTREEAEKCCMWLAENSVFPVTLSEVLNNLYCI